MSKLPRSRSHLSIDDIPRSCCNIVIVIAACCNSCFSCCIPCRKCHHRFPQVLTLVLDEAETQCTIPRIWLWMSYCRVKDLALMRQDMHQPMMKCFSLLSIKLMSYGEPAPYRLHPISCCRGDLLSFYFVIGSSKYSMKLIAAVMCSRNQLCRRNRY